MKIEGGLTTNKRSTNQVKDRAQIIIPKHVLSHKTLQDAHKAPTRSFTKGQCTKKKEDKRKEKEKKQKNKTKRKREKRKEKKKTSNVSHSEPTHSISSKAVKLSEGCPVRFSVELIVLISFID